MKADFKHIDKFRIASGEYGSTPEMGRAGAFMLPLLKERNDTVLMVIATDGDMGDVKLPKGEVEWEHVSAHVRYLSGRKGVNPRVRMRTPTWDEMHLLKDLFWEKDEVVQQFHPAESAYVNNHPHVLHLWKPVPRKVGFWRRLIGTFPVPPTFLVGLTPGQQLEPNTDKNER